MYIPCSIEHVRHKQKGLFVFKEADWSGCIAVFFLKLRMLDITISVLKCATCLLRGNFPLPFGHIYSFQK